jgi:L-threonylcarbamoyladenylate synthase
LKNNKAAIVETDTVMGIISKNPTLIYKIKKRARTKKLVRFVSSIKEVPGLTMAEKQALNKYWPGGLTIIKNGIGYRIPNHAKLLELINKVNGVYSSSANISGKAPIYDDQEALNTFKHYPFDVVIVKGHQQDDTSSTIVDLDKLKILRVGNVDGSAIISALMKENK